MTALSLPPFFSSIALTEQCRSTLPGLTASLTPSFSGSDGLRRKISLETQQLAAPSVARPLSYYRCSRGCPAAVAAVAAVASDVPPVSETKANFLKFYKKPIPTVYSNVIQELLVLQHLIRYNRTYQYDALFALGFVTVYDQLMDGYPSTEDREAIFKAYINALREDPDHYRRDAQKLAEWAASQNAESIVSFSSKEGEPENTLKDIAKRVGGQGNFHYNRFYAIGLFCLVELAKASDPLVLEQLSKSFNISKRSVDRDLDVYRNLLSKLAQAKELMKEYIDREKKKQAEREASSKADGAAVAKVGVKLECIYASD
ncbi:hypothetical protein O6H91_22G051300 [Diphasiastrum complanatum]|uniref:Uncharacterized protein n=1 Tax=Diphasiastrum complanatum TaxID=34168 RepID=A0ACC2AFE2_DIPCM|nr:hypothetical protein O6H91_22G051300 [Diphasiastrum complanatum]